MTLEDIRNAQILGAKILQAMISSSGEVDGEVRNLRNRAAEYLRRGIEEVRAAAGYVFRNDEQSMERYPSLFMRKRKKITNGKSVEEVNPSLPENARSTSREATEPPSGLVQVSAI